MQIHTDKNLIGVLNVTKHFILLAILQPTTKVLAKQEKGPLNVQHVKRRSLCPVT